MNSVQRKELGLNDLIDKVEICEEQCHLRCWPLSGFVSESSEGILRVVGLEIHLVSARNES